MCRSVRTAPPPWFPFAPFLFDGFGTPREETPRVAAFSYSHGSRQGKGTHGILDSVLPGKALVPPLVSGAYARTMSGPTLGASAPSLGSPLKWIESRADLRPAMALAAQRDVSGCSRVWTPQPRVCVPRNPLPRTCISGSVPTRCALPLETDPDVCPEGSGADIVGDARCFKRSREPVMVGDTAHQGHPAGLAQGRAWLARELLGPSGNAMD